MDETPEGRMRRTREIEIDLLVAHELATGSPAGEFLWRSVGWEPPTEPPTVLYQPTRGNTSRTTDVEARASVGRLLIEDKAPGGHFEEDQPRSYAAELGRDPTARSLLVAPRALIDRHPSDAQLFSNCVSLEDLAKVLADAVEGDDSELERGYAWRAGEFTRCALPSMGDRTSNPDEWVIELAISTGSSHAAEASRSPVPYVASSRGSCSFRIGGRMAATWICSISSSAGVSTCASLIGSVRALRRSSNHSTSKNGHRPAGAWTRLADHGRSSATS